MPCARSRSSWTASCRSCRQLLEQLAGPVRDRSAASCCASRSVHGQRDQVLLGAVVQVAFDLAPLGVGGRDDPGTGRPQLLRLPPQLVAATPATPSRAARCAAPGPTWRASSASTLSSSSLKRSASAGRSTTMKPEQLARVGDRRHAHGDVATVLEQPGQPDLQPRRSGDPARATTGCSSSDRSSAGRSPFGHRHDPLEVARRAGPHLGRLAAPCSCAATRRAGAAARRRGWPATAGLPKVRSASSGARRSP